MTQTVSFPALGLEFHLNRVAFTLFGLPIYWYGVLLAAGVFFGISYAFANAKRVGVDGDRFVDAVMGGVVGSLVGARAYYVIFAWDMYKDNLLDIFNYRKGGIAIYGAVIGGLLVGGIICRARKVKILPSLDLMAGGFLIGQAIGRWGNFVNVEAFGDNTTSIFGMASPAITGYLQQMKNTGAAWAANIDPSMPVHPTFFYESVWCFVGFLLVAFVVMRHRRFDGEAFLFYLTWYGAGRFVIEGLRTDSLMWGTIRASQALAAICVVVASGLWLYLRVQCKKQGAAYRPLYVTTPEGQKVVNGTFYQTAAVPEIVVEETERTADVSAGEEESPVLEEGKAGSSKDETTEEEDKNDGNTH